MMDEGHDRREFVRVPFRTATTVRTADRTIWAESTLDLSMNGIRVATTEQPPAPGTYCEVEVVLSDTDTLALIEARGSLVRSAPGTLAVHFTEIDLDSYHHLRQVVVNNAKDPERAEQEIRAHRGIKRPL